MTNRTESETNSPATDDASKNALAREQAAEGKEVPVKQHNPSDKGLNPGQKGPAQPTGNDH